MHTKKELDERLKAAGFRPLKQLGQNFLVNPEISRRIVEPILEMKPSAVVEIGPGMGALTDDLINQTWKLLLVEWDAGFVRYWQSREGSLEILHRDALKVDWSEISLPRPRALVSNLPYSIAASLVVEVSAAENPPFDFMILMFQKEVAQRIEAKTDDEDYGMLSVVAQCSWNIKKVVDAGPQDFYPVPNVGSRVLSFTPKKALLKPSQFLAFVKLGFSQRRKKLMNNLTAQHGAEALQKAFEVLGLSEGVRAQELTPDQWVELFNHLRA